MRQILSKLESSILATIDTGAGRRHVKTEVITETGCTMKEVDQAIKRLKTIGLLRYEEQGSFLVANFAKHHGKDILFDRGLDVYSYEDGR